METERRFDFPGAGYTLLRRLDTGVPDLFIEVEPQARFQGRSREMTRRTLAWLSCNGYGGAMACVDRRNPAAMGVCARHGFRFFASDGDACKYLCRLPLPRALDDIPPTESPDGVVIRAFCPSDRAAVEAFFDGLGGESRSFFDRGDGNRDGALSFFTEGAKDTRRWMAVSRDGVMLGYVFLWSVSAGVPGFGIAVCDACKGRGLGARLMAHAQQYALRAGCGGIELTHSAANTRGMRLYEKSGFAAEGLFQEEIARLLRFPRS